MTSQELLKIAHAVEPQKMDSVAAMLFLTEKLDPEFGKEASEGIQFILERASSGLEKTANEEGMSKAEKFLRSPGGVAAMVVGGPMVGSLGTALATDMYEWARQKLTASGNFKRILKENPHLEESFTKGELRKSFDTLHRFGPEFTADPYLGGQLLFSATKSPENKTTIIREMLGNRKNLVEIKQRQFAPRFEIAEGINRHLDTVERERDRKVRNQQFEAGFQQREKQISQTASERAQERAQRAADLARREAAEAERERNRLSQQIKQRKAQEKAQKRMHALKKEELAVKRQELAWKMSRP
jgi:hypothetical protein